MSRGEKWTIAIGLIALFGVGLQIWLAVIHEQEHRVGVVTTLLTILLWVVLGVVNVYSIYRNLKDAHRSETVKANAEAEAKKLTLDIKTLLDEEKDAGGQAALCWYFAASARDLISQLEQTWHHWNAAGEALVYPVGGGPGIRNWSGQQVTNLVNERRDFMVLYANHLMRLKLDLPEFSSPFLQYGYPSETEYSILISSLREHAEMLDRMGESVWKSGHVLEVPSAKTS